MITQILIWLLDVKSQLDSIQLASLLGVQWVGTDLSFWDVLCILFFTGSLITIFFPSADDADDEDEFISDY